MASTSQRWAALALSLLLTGPLARGQTEAPALVGSGPALRFAPEPVDPAGPAPSFGGEAAPMEARRQLSRRFAVPRRAAAFALDTRYGRVRLVAWSRPEIKVETELVARAETAPQAAALLAALGVSYLAYEARTGGVAVSSTFGPGLRGGPGGGCRYEINYTVWLPATAALRVTTAFADVTLAGDWQGPAALSVSYGSLRTDRLTGPGSVVRITNGDATLAFARQASLVADYARLRVGGGGQLVLRTRYADVDLGAVRDLTIHSIYGDVALGRVDRLRGSSGYARFSVAAVSENLDMALRYCPDFEVRDLGAGFRQVTLDGGFSTIRLGCGGVRPPFRFDVSTEQGQLLVDKNLVRVLSAGETSPGVADVLGVWGRGRAPAPGAGTVSIRLRHGTVRFSR